MVSLLSLSHIQVVAIPGHKVGEVEGACLQALLSQGGVPDVQLKTARLSIAGIEVNHELLVPGSYPVYSSQGTANSGQCTTVHSGE